MRETNISYPLVRTRAKWMIPLQTTKLATHNTVKTWIVSKTSETVSNKNHWCHIILLHDDSGLLQTLIASSYKKASWPCTSLSLKGTYNSVAFLQPKTSACKSGISYRIIPTSVSKYRVKEALSLLNYVSSCLMCLDLYAP